MIVLLLLNTLASLSLSLSRFVFLPFFRSRGVLLECVRAANRIFDAFDDVNFFVMGKKNVCFL